MSTPGCGCNLDPRQFIHAKPRRREELITAASLKSFCNGVDFRKLNKILEKMGIQHVVNKQWIPYKKYLGNGYVVGHPIELPNGKTKEVTRWTRAGQKFIYSKLKEAGYLPVGEQIRMETC